MRDRAPLDLLTSSTRRPDEIATALIEHGTQPGDRIGIWSPNSAEWSMIQYATAQVGAILVNINPAYRTDELQYVLNQSSMCTVFAAPEFKSSDYAAMLDNVRGRCPALSDVIIIGWEPWQQIADTPADADALSRVQSGLKPSDPINIQYTSGTTGFPKGAMLTHTNILNNGYLVGEGLQYTEQDRVCIPVPFYHCFGMVLGNLACTTHGATMVIPAPGFDPDATSESRCGRAMYIAVRGTDDVHQRARATELRRLRPEHPADGCDGRCRRAPSR